MLNVGKILLERDAPQSNYRFGFHQPPFYSVDHLHLHCLALPFIPSWKRMKYSSAGPFGFLEVDKLLAKLRPVSESSSQDKSESARSGQSRHSTSFNCVPYTVS
ncbi:bifunctional adenosine 5'-phosphosulfate phosphorylase/adenylylsulfatase HINT4-like [Curcuma longa]|uniref:bifunctional adenosine 5'-phosphosulfate phosphorylase/adenylylsulfatase HINT4-like n=1 Tax=Curcuma longa TaxID=136217 RepID=UPI003D9DEE2B